MNKKFRFVLLWLCPLLLIGGVWQGCAASKEMGQVVQLQQFKNCEELSTHLKKLATEELQQLYIKEQQKNNTPSTGLKNQFRAYARNSGTTAPSFVNKNADQGPSPAGKHDGSGNQNGSGGGSASPPNQGGNGGLQSGGGEPNKGSGSNDTNNKNTGGSSNNNNAQEPSPGNNTGSNSRNKGTEESSGFSTTNNQTKGVDEPDIVKTDGKYIYVLNKNYFLLYNASPAVDTRELSRYKLSSPATEMHVYKNRVAIFSKTAQVAHTTELSHTVGRPSSPKLTRMMVLDTSDKENPTLIRDLFMEGEYRTARRIQQTVRVVLYTKLPNPNPKQFKNPPTWANDYKSYLLKNEQLKTIANSSLKDWLPIYQDTHFNKNIPSLQKVQQTLHLQTFLQTSQYIWKRHPHRRFHRFTGSSKGYPRHFDCQW